MKLLQPLPDVHSPLVVSEQSKVLCPYPVKFIRFRYRHHAAPSGYDRICDYIDAPAIRPSRVLHVAGETLLRPVGLWHAKRGGKYEYSRYDFTMEMAVIADLLRCQGGLYHFIYAEKSFHLLERYSGRRGHRFVGTVHHPEDHQSWMFQSHSHFKAFDHLVSMDRRSIEYWESVTGQRNVTWIPHGVDVDYFRPLMSRSVGPFRVVFAGQHDRDFEALSQVVRTVAERTSDIHFVLIGKHQQLKELASQVPNAVQVENLTDEEYLKALQEADLLLLPLLSSTVCNVVLEGMACGTPVVTTGGGIEDYLEDESAVVVLKGDVEGMVDAILVQADVRSGHKLSSHSARRQSERFSWSEVSRRHVELYASALQ